MIQPRRPIATRLIVILFAIQIVTMVDGLSQQAVGGGSGPSYKILDGSLFIVMGKTPISLATDQNFMIEDITPCLAANQYSPTYSCTDQGEGREL